MLKTFRVHSCNHALSQTSQLFGAVSFFIFGLASSLHCLGMCAPLSQLMLDGKNTKHSSKVLPLTLYHFMRLAAYALLGGAFVLLGTSLQRLTQQPILSWLLIALLLVVAFGKQLQLPSFLRPQLWGRLVGKASPLHRAALLGFFSPLLPCGVLYFALAAAAQAPTVGTAAGWMALFAGGTIPLLFVGQYSLQAVRRLAPAWFEATFTKLMALVTIAFILWMHYG